MTAVLEALLLSAVTGDAATFAERNAASKPSLELLEFLGEFGDDEEGVFESGVAGSRAPAKEAVVAPVKPRTPPAPPSTTSPTSPPASKASP